jgi:uncharacterized membrane protein
VDLRFIISAFTALTAILLDNCIKLQLGEVSHVAPVDKLSVAIAIILSVLFLGELFTLKTRMEA